MNDRRFWEIAAAALRADGVVYFSRVVRSSKGSPGTPAARMLVRADGTQAGTIGGGVMERDRVDEARKLLRLGRRLPPVLELLEHRAGADAASGLICGGEQTNLTWLLAGEEDRRLVEEVLLALASGSRAFLEVTAAGGRIVAAAPEAEGEVRLDWTGQEWRVRLPLWNPRRIVVFGGGHCGVALANLMEGLGFATALVEPREEVFTLTQLVPDVLVIRLPFAEAVQGLPFAERTLGVVMTHGMPSDVDAYEAAARSGLGWVRVMGSPAKRRVIREQLQARGLAEAALAGVLEPLGIEFDANTPEEIAVSVAAQILLGRL